MGDLGVLACPRPPTAARRLLAMAVITAVSIGRIDLIAKPFAPT